MLTAISFGSTRLLAQFTPPERIVLEGDSGVFFNRNSETVLIAKHLHRLELAQANFELNRSLIELRKAYDSMKQANDLLRQADAQNQSAINLLRKERDHFASEAEDYAIALSDCRNGSKLKLWLIGGGGLLVGFIAANQSYK